MSNFNKVILMGRLTRDPEMRYTNSNMAVCKVGLAVNRKTKGQDGQWKEEPVFVDVTLFDKRAEAFEKFHKKGDAAFFEGELRLDQWEDKETGQKRSKLYVVANSWEFVGGKSERQQEPASSGYGGGGYERKTSDDAFLGADEVPF